MGKEQDLLSASKSGDIQQVRKLLSKLRKAVSSSKLEVPDAEVATGAKAKKTKNSSALKKSGKFVNVNTTDDDCFTALHHSALLEKADVCKELLAVEASVDLRDKNGMSPLHLAAWAGRAEQASVLLRSGADPNAVSNNGETALILTAQYGKTDVASILLNHKADVGAVGSGGLTALDKACQFGHLEMVELLVTCGALNYVHQLKDANKHDPNKQTPLHLAAKHGHLEIIRALLFHGVDVNLETANGTSLHEAALYGRKDIVKLLVECGVDVNRRNVYQQTALDIVQHFVRSAAAKEMKTILIESGCANVTLARANFDYRVADSMMLSFSEGETVVVLEQNAEGPWKGSVGDGESKRTGFFPPAAVTLLVKRPESLGSVAALVTGGGQIDPHLSPPEPDSLYDCLRPKMTDMPSPPVPDLDEKDEDVHPYGTLVRVAPQAKPKPLIRDQSFTGQYMFEEDVSKARRVPPTGVYEEVDLSRQLTVHMKKGLNYAEMDLQPSDSPVRGNQPKTLYAEVALPPVPGNGLSVISEEGQSLRRSSSLSQTRKPAYENVEVFGRRAMSVSKPRPVPPARKSSQKKPASYENVDLPEQTQIVSPSPRTVSPSPRTVSPSPRTVSPSPQPVVLEDDETYEVMDRVLAGRSPTVGSDSEYLTMHRASDPHQPKQQVQVEGSVQSPPKKRVSPYEVMTLNREDKNISVLNADAGPEEAELDIKSPTSPSTPVHLESDLRTQPLPIVDWLMHFNLQDYSDHFVTAGYDDSSYLVEISEKDLVAIGIDKPGHRKKILHLASSTVAALSDVFPSTKPSSVSDWFKALGMSLYEPAFLKQGYDDIDFVVDITEDELKEMGVTQQGHLRKLMVAIAKLSQLEEREEQSERIAESKSERKALSEERDAVSPLTSEVGVTSPHRAEPSTQKVPPPKPKRPVKGWESPLLHLSMSDEDQVNPVEKNSHSSGDNCQEKPAPPVRKDSIHRTREQMDKLQGDPGEAEVAKARSKSGKLPPPPPRRDDSLAVSPTCAVKEPATDGTKNADSPSRRGPPSKPMRVDSVKNATAEVEEAGHNHTWNSSPAAPVVQPPPPPDLLSDVLSEFAAATAVPPSIAPKPAVKPKPPAVAKKPVTAVKPSVSNKPATSFPAAATVASPLTSTPQSSVVHKPVPPVAAKRKSPESSTIAPPVPQKAAVKPKPPPVEVPPVSSDDLVENHVKAELSLEDAIKTVLRSPTTPRRHMSPVRDSPKTPRHDLQSHDLPPYEPANSDKLMDDIDNMLKDLNKELDELIPGM